MRAHGPVVSGDDRELMQIPDRLHQLTFRIIIEAKPALFVPAAKVANDLILSDRLERGASEYVEDGYGNRFFAKANKASLVVRAYPPKKRAR